MKYKLNFDQILPVFHWYKLFRDFKDAVDHAEFLNPVQSDAIVTCTIKSNIIPEDPNKYSMIIPAIDKHGCVLKHIELVGWTPEKTDVLIVTE